jgi:DNA adenine methylase
MQTSLFSEELVQTSDRVVNVASVPQRSPFRYPGGKTWLIPRLRQWLESQAGKPQEFIEPFAGGGIASLTTAFENRAEWVTMVELDEQVAAVWRVILQQPDGGEWLANRIIHFDLTPENAQKVLGQPHPSLRDVAFRTLLKNRITHGGILAAGVGILKHGENGKGIKSRWYPETLRKRILDIVQQRDHIQFIEGDGIKVLSSLTHLTPWAKASAPARAFTLTTNLTTRNCLRLLLHSRVTF